MHTWRITLIKPPPHHLTLEAHTAAAQRPPPSPPSTGCPPSLPSPVATASSRGNTHTHTYTHTYANCLPPSPNWRVSPGCTWCHLAMAEVSPSALPRQRKPHKHHTRRMRMHTHTPIVHSSTTANHPLDATRIMHRHPLPSANCQWQAGVCSSSRAHTQQGPGSTSTHPSFHIHTQAHVSGHMSRRALPFLVAVAVRAPQQWGGGGRCRTYGARSSTQEAPTNAQATPLPAASRSPTGGLGKGACVTHHTTPRLQAR